MEAMILETEHTLNAEEQQRLSELQQKVDKNFYAAGKALREIRNKKLYRDYSDTFEAFCEEKFKISRRYGYYLIEASITMDHIKSHFELMCGEMKMDPSANTLLSALPIMPTSEYQIRPLGKLDCSLRGEVWAELVRECPKGNPSHATVAKKVQEHLSHTQKKSPNGRTPTPGSLCFINKRGWGFVQADKINRLEVLMWDGTVAHFKSDSCNFLTEDASILKIYHQLRGILSKLGQKAKTDACGSVLIQLFSHRKKAAELTKLELSLLKLLIDHYR